jgi:hypothetical protein
VDYEEHLVGVDREGMRDLDVSPERLDGVALNGHHVGTMRYKVRVDMDGFSVSTPGRETLEQGGLLPGVRRVSRSGGTGEPVADSALSLANLPYIWGSAPLDGVHQAERHIGADCADLVVAAWRMAGLEADYSAVIPMILGRPGAEVTDVVKGHYLVSGSRIPVEPGQAVAWRFGPGNGKGHVAIVVEDSGPLGVPNGVLDAADLALHAMWSTPRLQKLGDVLPMDPVAVIAAPEAP